MSTPVFEIGLSMAGAISAGAYSGGVFDFLCEALDEWEKQKAKEALLPREQQTVPNHAVCIRAISGASAGSLTAAIGVVALTKGRHDVEKLIPAVGPLAPAAFRTTLPSLYVAWVEDIDLAFDAALKKKDLLSLDDLATGTEITSLLNSATLDGIADTVMKSPGFGALAARQWLGNPLHLFFMVTNLRGVPYDISFSSGDDAGAVHGMMNYGDFAHFAISGIGSGLVENFWCQNGAPVPLNAATFTPVSWQVLVDNGKASSAFPAGLAAREISTSAESYFKRVWPVRDGATNAVIAPSIAAGFPPPPAVVPFVAPDGGMIDNEPFEFAHSAILDENTTHNPRDENEATKAVILIDPFPERPDYELSDDLAKDNSLIAVIKQIFPVYKDQARFKLDELASAVDETIYSRYLISPKGSDSDSNMSSAALATGLLGGFGGFLDVSFRAHDYQLGRRNCQRFLQQHLAVGLNNPIVRNADGMLRWSDKAYRDFQDKPASPADTHRHVLVIPCVGTAAIPVAPAPQWPRINIARVDEIIARIDTRARTLVPKLIKDKLGTPIVRLGARCLWSAFGTNALKDFARWAIMGELFAHDQLVEYTDRTRFGIDDLRIAAALCDTKYDYRTVPGLMAALKLSQGAVRDGLARLLTGTEKVWGGTVSGQLCYTWERKRPGFWSRNISFIGGDPKIG